MFLLGLAAIAALVLVALRYYVRKTPPVTVTSFVRPVDPSFKWNEAVPMPVRPFVGKRNFNPNMGVRNLSKTPEDWLLLENTYKNVTTMKKQLTSQHPSKTLHVDDSPRAHLAAREFYTKVLDFMCCRYPQYFVRHGSTVHNLINNEVLPDPKSVAPRELLEILSGNIEEDVVILMKDDPDEHDQEYVMRGAIVGFASGFDPSHGFNQPISKIHQPVPQYKPRLHTSMAKFFNNLTPMDLWVRLNWSVQTHKNHFAISGNHAYDGELKALTVDEIDFDDSCFLRCERQVLTRLPQSRAFIMTIRTYLTLVKQVKQEGLGDEMIRGIDSLPDDLAFYKRRGAWGEAVKEYLRS